MRRAGAVSVSGAIFLALLCIALISLLPNPVGAQVEEGDPATIIDDPDDTDEIPDRIEIDLPAGQTCSVTPDATIIVTHENGTPFTLTNGTNAEIDVEQDQIIITIDEEPEPAVPEGFEEGTGTFEGSTGIECVGDAAGGRDGNGNGGDGNDNGSDDGQYGDDEGDVDDPDDVVPGTGDDDPLPDTGGAPLLFGAAALVLAAALLARRILAP